MKMKAGSHERPAQQGGSQHETQNIFESFPLSFCAPKTYKVFVCCLPQDQLLFSDLQLSVLIWHPFKISALVLISCICKNDIPTFNLNFKLQSTLWLILHWSLPLCVLVQYESFWNCVFFVCDSVVLMQLCSNFTT